MFFVTAVNVSRLSTVVLAARGVPVGEFLGSRSKSDATKENVGRLARCLIARMSTLTLNIPVYF